MRGYQEVFLLAAKAGALEGYLFGREEVEPLTNWIDNISQMYCDLSPEVKRELALVLIPVLKRTLEYGKGVLVPELKVKLEQMLVESSVDLKRTG